MQLKRVAEAKLPTPWGDFLMVGFEELATGHDHVALVFGDITGQTPVLARVHSECLTGDALFSLRCDCGFQLKRPSPTLLKKGVAFCFITVRKDATLACSTKSALTRCRIRVMIPLKRIISWDLRQTSAISRCVPICSSCWAWMRYVC